MSFVTFYEAIRKLYDVLYVFEIKIKLLSISIIIDKCNEVYFSKSGA